MGDPTQTQVRRGHPICVGIGAHTSHKGNTTGSDQPTLDTRVMNRPQAPRQAPVLCVSVTHGQPLVPRHTLLGVAVAIAMQGCRSANTRCPPPRQSCLLSGQDVAGALQKMQSGYDDLDTRLMREAQNIAMLNTKVLLPVVVACSPCPPALPPRAGGLALV